MHRPLLHPTRRFQTHHAPPTLSALSPLRRNLLRPSPSPLHPQAWQVRPISIPQIMFNPTSPHISIPSANGPLTRNIRPSFPLNAVKVVAELNALFAEQRPLPFSDASSPTPLPGTWQLDPTCDSISGFFLLPSREDVPQLTRRVLTAAEELNHHPSLSAAEGADGRWVLLATCGTHRPAGLSVKDARLARRIGELAMEYVEVQRAEEGLMAQDGLVEWHWRENMGRARVRMHDGVEEGEVEDGKSIDQERYWRLNTVEDVDMFVESVQKRKGEEGNLPNLKGLVL